MIRNGPACRVRHPCTHHARRMMVICSPLIVNAGTVEFTLPSQKSALLRRFRRFRIAKSCGFLWHVDTLCRVVSPATARFSARLCVKTIIHVTRGSKRGSRTARFCACARCPMQICARAPAYWRACQTAVAGACAAATQARADDLARLPEVVLGVQDECGRGDERADRRAEHAAPALRAVSLRRAILFGHVRDTGLVYTGAGRVLGFTVSSNGLTK